MGLSIPGGFAAAIAAAVLIHAPAVAENSSPGETLPEVVVTAERTPQPIARTGSAISIVHRQDIETTNPTTLVDALRAVPGLDVTETGGPGGTTSVRLRGANPDQTLVLIDGIRVNDPAAARGDFDFSMFPAGTIERIEVLRGPQSALYGSDAIGGVINIITKTGEGPARAAVRTEAGSYGTLATSGSFAGSNGPWSYAFSGAGQRSDGFSRYGYRIPAIERRFPNLERDGFERFSGSGRIAYDVGNGVRIDLGALASWLRADYDAATGAFPDTPSAATRFLQQIWARTSVDTLEGALSHDLRVFANRTDRSFNDVTYKINTLPKNTTSTISDFIGDRIGAEYQGNLRMGAFGSLVYGAKLEHETADTFSARLLPTFLPRAQTLAAQQDTHSAFALWQLPIGERLIVTAGGRVDDVIAVARFATWRTTAAFLLPETGTKLRASAGTGGKAPTLFQLHDPMFGNPSLQPEESFGWDTGLDQSLLGGRLTASLTAFANRLSNLIDFDTTAMRYFNVARAATEGIETTADAEIWPKLLRLKTTYTYLRATDLQTGLALARRPVHSGRVALAVTPNARWLWLIEPRLIVVSERFSSSGERDRLAPYARLDLYSDYRIDATWRAFARLENVTNVRYQEVLNYGTTGRAIYAGFDATW